MRPHWWLSGPSRTHTWDEIRANDGDLRHSHVATFRRLLRIGPFSVCVLRYRPGSRQE